MKNEGEPGYNAELLHLMWDMRRGPPPETDKQAFEMARLHIARARRELLKVRDLLLIAKVNEEAMARTAIATVELMQRCVIEMYDHAPD